MIIKSILIMTILSKMGSHTYSQSEPSRAFQSPYHEGTKVTTLFHSCIQYVAGHLKDYDLQDFPDEFIIKYVSFFT